MRLTALAVVGILAVGAWSLVAQEPKSAAVLMQAAAAKETIQGDLKGAAALYEQAIAQGEVEGSRPLTSTALQALGEVYLKLVDARAAACFERIVRAWAPDSRSVLIRRVPKPGAAEIWWAPVDGRTPRLLLSGSDATFGAFRIHPDGRRVVFSEREDSDAPEELRVLEQFLPSASRGRP